MKTTSVISAEDFRNRQPQMSAVDNACRKSMSVKGTRGLDFDSALRLRIDALLRAGVDRNNIHLDKASGAKNSRPSLDLALKLLREGDTQKVTRLDRLSRSVLHLVTLGADLRECGVGLHVIEQGIDTDTMEGRAMFGMLSVLSELQRELIVANTMDGLASARARGRVGGRRPKLTADQAALAQQLYDTRDKTVQQIADLFGVPRSTVYGHLKGGTVRRRPKKTLDGA
ncbi:recombinase family protein [Nonomuraea terrae]|uniref:recombinase family protein n=1 Tax=Nonomuraea terrae TaxID=2530383 RepID=UPI003787BCE8